MFASSRPERAWAAVRRGPRGRGRRPGRVVERLEPRTLLAGDAGSSAVLEWIAAQGYELFRDQFGLTSMAGQVDEFRRGVADEHEVGTLFPDNPFGDAFPAFRQYWAPSPGFTGPRSPAAGANILGVAYDSAPNRAIKYLTGGYGHDDALDPTWDPAALGAAARYDSSTPDLAGAFGDVGHIARLLAGLSVPAQALGDFHAPEIPGLFAPDPDPYLDWISGEDFSPSNPDPDRPTAIDDRDPLRFTRYAIADLDGSASRSAYEIDPAFAPGAGDPDWRPMYRLFADVAGVAERFDSKDADGAVERGTVRDPGGLAAGESREARAGRYRNFTAAELDAQAGVLIPEAIRRVSELIRVFYGVVDDVAPSRDGVVLASLSSRDPAAPQVLPDSTFSIDVAATDQGTGDSGIGRGRFRIQYRSKPSGAGAWGDWTDLPELGLVRGQAVDSFDPSVSGLGGRPGAMIRAPFRIGQAGFDYAFRARAEDGAGNLSEWSPESYVRIEGGAAAVLVIDRSGSMTVGGKMQAARQAGGTFIDLLHDGDSIAVASFSTAAALDFARAVVASGNGVRPAAQAAVNALIPGGNTAIGAGLLVGSGQLAGAPPGRRAIVLMSDGMENELPAALDIIDQVPEDVRIFTIGFGPEADPALLQEIARRRNGRYYFAATNAELREIYVSLAGIATGEQDVLHDTGTILPGGRIVRTFVVDPTAGGATVGVQWPGSNLDLSLIAPDGTVITRNSTDPRVRFVGGATSEFFQIATPQLGMWQAVVDAVSVDVAGEQFELFARLGSLIRADLDSDGGQYAVGEGASFLVALNDGQAILGAEVTGFLSPPAGSIEPPKRLTFLDDGRHGDGVAGDGIYGASVILGHAGAGTYDLRVEATGRTASGISFVRMPSRSVAVTGLGRSDANNAPVLAPIADLVALQGQAVRLTARATDADSNPLVFSLDAGPPGAGIDPITGAFSWTPAADLAPGSYTARVRVAEGARPSASDSVSFAVRVAEFNLPPRLAPIADQAATIGATLDLAVSATDPDSAAGALRYGLDPTAPAGATIDPASGAFSWTPPASVAPGPYVIVVRVVDPGAPNQAAATTIRVNVGAAPGPSDPPTTPPAEPPPIDASPPPADTAGPQVRSAVLQLSPRRDGDRIRIAFSEPLNAARARDLGAYTLVDAGPDQRLGTRDDRRLALRAAEYDPVARLVTLSVARRLPRRRHFQLAIAGNGPAGLTDGAGNMLDGDGDGRPGGDYRVVLRTGGAGLVRVRVHPNGPRRVGRRSPHG